MIIAVSASGNDLDSPIDERFGRTNGFIIHNQESGNSKYLPNNQNLHAAQGAGIQAAQTVSNAGAEAVITGHCGPKAFRVLSGAGIKIFLIENKTVKEALSLLEKGKIKESLAADVEGHW